MRTALYAGLVAGAVVLHSTAIAGEGSSLRGLKAPIAAWERLTIEPAVSEGLKHPSPATVFDLAPRTAFYAGSLDSRNISLNDTDLKFGYYRPLGASTSLLGGGNVNPLFDAIPKYTLYSQVMQPLGGGFGLGVGMRRSEYNFAGSNLLALSAEQSVGSFRGAYTLYSNRSETPGSGAAHRFALSYAYGDRNTVGLAYTTGRDVDNFNVPLGSPLAVSPADVRDWSVSGRHWLTTNWALTYDVQTQENALRTRQGLRLGVSRSF